ncbi:MAG: HIT family protein [Anaerolineae bacterium]|jgi:diadenosine tetraphosphate (Ap4A) HIT family hydrolase
MASAPARDLDTGLVPGCLSCELLAGRRPVPGGTIWEDDFWRLESAVSPVVWSGFLILKLKRHCEHLAELTPAEAAALGPAIRASCAALARVLAPAKIYVASFGDGVRHIHFWLLPRPRGTRPGLHRALLRLDLRGLVARLGVRRWIVPDEEVADLAAQVRRALDAPPHA